jgi:hypothetical protein
MMKRMLAQIAWLILVLAATGSTAQEAQGTTTAASAPGANNARPAGMKLEWTHFLGGSRGDGLFRETRLAIESDGVIGPDGTLWFAGATTSRDFPVTPDAVQKKFGGIQDEFLVEFDTNRRKVDYATFLGGARQEVAWAGLYVDRPRNRVVVGSCTGSPDFPTTEDALVREFQGPEHRHADGVLVILGDGGRKLSYSTFLGGPKIDLGPWRVFVDPSGDIVVFGNAGSFDFLPVDVVQDPGLRNRGGCYILKLDSKGKYIMSRVLGGADVGIQDVQKLASGDYLVMATANTGGDDNTANKARDVLAMRVSADLRTVTSAPRFGGTGDEDVLTVSTVPGGDFFVFGYTSSKDLPVTADAIEKTLNVERAMFLARFGADARQLKYCTYLGGKSGTTGHGRSLVYDGHGRIHVAWITTSPDCPVTSNAFQGKPAGGDDVFLLSMNVADNTLAYGSYLGGSKNDGGACLAVDESGALYVVGGTDSEDFPTGSEPASSRRKSDIFITKFSVPSDQSIGKRK